MQACVDDEVRKTIFFCSGRPATRVRDGKNVMIILRAERKKELKPKEGGTIAIGRSVASANEFLV